MANEYRKNLGKLLKQKRLNLLMTLREVSVIARISPSHLGRIENGERFPSAAILRKIAQPLGFEERELFTLAGYLSAKVPSLAEKEAIYQGKDVDPYVARILAQEPVEVQRAILGILAIFRSVAPALIAADGNKTKKTRKKPRSKRQV